MKNEKRLSLEDFKMKKIESKNEIDKLLGGTAAICHPTCNDGLGDIDWGCGNIG